MWPHCFFTSTMNDTHGSTACLFYVAMFHTLLFDLLYNVWGIVVELFSRWICINTWFDVALMIKFWQTHPKDKARFKCNVCDNLSFWSYVQSEYFSRTKSTHHFFRNACTKSGSLRFSQFSGCWLILFVYILMSFDFPFVRLLGVR
jgi:hypothetical protein